MADLSFTKNFDRLVQLLPIVKPIWLIPNANRSMQQKTDVGEFESIIKSLINAHIIYNKDDLIKVTNLDISTNAPEGVKKLMTELKNCRGKVDASYPNVIRGFNDYVRYISKSEADRNNIESKFITDFEENLSKLETIKSTLTQDELKILKHLSIQKLPTQQRTKLENILQNLIEVEQSGSDEKSSQDVEKSTSRLNFDKLDFSQVKNIMSQASNELTDELTDEFLKLLEEHFRDIVFKKSSGVQLTPAEWTSALVSYFTSLYEQSTTTKLADSKDALNSFNVGKIKYEWQRGPVTKKLTEHFRNKYGVENAERRFAKKEYNSIQNALAAAGYVSSERLAAKWGAAPNKRSKVSDATPMHKAHMTFDEQSVQLASTDYATDTDTTSSKGALHVSQVLGPRRGRRN
uniref:Putative viral coat protein n=1 Tax=Little cherry virus 1 TaxID=217686 RepID=A0A346RRJ7_9CLOS|nr:putative viral coat protein [Little cherry virus 1]